jgi:hypothetical protein
MKILDFGKYITAGVGILAGRERGHRARTAERLDAVDRKADEMVKVVVPEEVYSINSSFFLGMFEKSIVDLGEAEFRRRYLFEGDVAISARNEGIRIARLFKRPLIDPHA